MTSEEYQNMIKKQLRGQLKNDGEITRNVGMKLDTIYDEDKEFWYQLLDYLANEVPSLKEQIYAYPIVNK